jgi:hypothetical protein
MAGGTDRDSVGRDLLVSAEEIPALPRFDGEVDRMMMDKRISR